MSDVADGKARTINLVRGCLAALCWLPCTCEDIEFSVTLKIVGRHRASDGGFFSRVGR